VRKDDDPAVFPERLREYYKKTAPLTGYYYAKGMLRTVDGMAGVDAVTAAIEDILETPQKRTA
jgi:adenylate kinase